MHRPLGSSAHTLPTTPAAGRILSRTRLLNVLVITVALMGSVSAVGDGEKVFSSTRAKSPGASEAPLVTRRPAEAPLVRGGRMLRERTAEVLLDRLDEARAASMRDPTRGGSLELNLFDDVAFKAVELRSAPTSSGYSLSGRLDGVPFGTATLVVNGDVLIGTVRTPTGIYTIDPGGDSARIRQVDPSGLPPLAEPLLPPGPLRPAEMTRSARTPPPGALHADASEEDGTTVVDILIVYTPAVRQALGGRAQAEAFADLSIAEGNQALEDSGVELRFFLTQAAEIDYYETGHGDIELDRLRLADDGYMDIAHEWREETGADIVHLLVARSNVGGLAYLSGDDLGPDGALFPFSLAHYLYGGLVVVHELGHNMGLNHDRFVFPGTPTGDLTHGYVNQAGLDPEVDDSRRWHTIMAYPTQCEAHSLSCRRLPRFSNPDQTYLGDVLGVSAEASEAGSGAADARRVLNEARQKIAAYHGAATDLAVLSMLSDRALQPGDALTIETRIGNRGGSDAPATKGTYYRSGDAVIGPGDTELGTFELDGLQGRSEVSHSIDVEAPMDTGNHYYGVCVDAVSAEKDVNNNCSPGIRTTVGPTVSIADARAEEGAPVRFRVTLSESRPTAVEVRWALSGAQAIADVDYRQVAEDVLVIPADASEGTIAVETIEDTAAEGSESFSVRLVAVEPHSGDGVALSIDAHEAAGTIDDDDGEPVIVDAMLADAIRIELNKASTDPIRVGDLAMLTQLRAWSRGIESLEGLEAASNLRSISVQNNNIGDLSPLAHLARLEMLRIDANPVSDLSPLTNLPALVELGLDSTGMRDIGQLASLAKLRRLALRNNGIVDLGPLAALNLLMELELAGNAVVDLSPLRQLSHLTKLTLTNNSITDLAPLSGLNGLSFLYLQENRVADLSPLAALQALYELNLSRNAVSDIAPLASVIGLRTLNLAHNEIRDIGPLENLTNLLDLDLSFNRIRNIAPLGGHRLLIRVSLANNDIQDIAPLVNIPPLPRGITRDWDLANNAIADVVPLASNSSIGKLVLTGNPLSGQALSTDIPALRMSGIDVTYIRMTVAVASAVEGQMLSFPVNLEFPPTEDVAVNYKLKPLSADVAADYADSGSGVLTVAAGSTSATIDVLTNEDEDLEPIEAISVALQPPDGGLAGGVVIALGTATGIIADPAGEVSHTPFFAPADHETRQGFLRIVNLGRYGIAHIDAIDERSHRVATTLAIKSPSARHFNSQDLAHGNTAKGLPRGVGDGEWRLEVRGEGIIALTYMRTRDGFLTSLHDTVPKTPDGYAVPIFNPASNIDQVSLLQLTNPGARETQLTVSGVDDRGLSSPGVVGLTLEPGESRTISAQELEAGTGLDGALGAGTGKWRLLVDSDQDLRVANLMASPTGHLTNLSTVPAYVNENGETRHLVPLFPSAADPASRQGFVRIINRGDSGTVQITARDDSSRGPRTTTLSLDAGETAHFNSNDLELGNAAKGLSPGIGAGEGDWWLELSTGLDVDVLAYLRRVNDGFLTSMHDVAPRFSDTYVYGVPTFNPGRNRDQVSWLRLVNTEPVATGVMIEAYDDNLKPASGTLHLTIPGLSARNISAQELEAGGDGLTGALGTGTGKWYVRVTSDGPLLVMGLLESPTGHVTNLSSVP